MHHTVLTVCRHERVALHRELKHRGQIVQIDGEHLTNLIDALCDQREVLAGHKARKTITQLDDVRDDALQPLLRQLEPRGEAASVLLFLVRFNAGRAEEAHGVLFDEVSEDHAHEAVKKEAAGGGNES